MDQIGAGERVTMARISEDKTKLLEDRGYRFHFRRLIYVQRREKKVFSVEALSDNSLEWLAARLGEENTSGTWRFYFNGTLPRSVREQVIADLEGHSR